MPRIVRCTDSNMSQDAALAMLLMAALNERRERTLLRERRAIERSGGVLVRCNGRLCVDFSSNDYLGLRSHSKIVQAAADATRRYGAGSGASPLVTGYSPVHASAERALATWKGTQSSVLLPSGYQANHAVVQTLAGSARAAGARMRFVLDKLVHASIIDAVRASRLPMRVFPHNGIAKLRRLLDEADEGELQVVITESIFSMDGDAADLRALAELKRRKPFALVVDEAHGSGVYGPDGAGYAAECGVSGDVDVFVVTLSKALGSIGGAVCASTDFCAALANFGRAYIYSTSVPPSAAAAVEAALQVIRKDPARQRAVRSNANRVRAALRGSGASLPDGDSPIIPVLLGSERSAIFQARRLEELGMLVMPIRPPTVPPGSSRLRITLSCEHSEEQITALIRALGEMKKSSSGVRRSACAGTRAKR